jgi:hypothetical protein
MRKITEAHVSGFIVGMLLTAALLTGARWLDRNQPPYCEHRIEGPCPICRVPFVGPGRDPRGFEPPANPPPRI